MTITFKFQIHPKNNWILSINLIRYTLTCCEKNFLRVIAGDSLNTDIGPDSEAQISNLNDEVDEKGLDDQYHKDERSIDDQKPEKNKDNGKHENSKDSKANTSV